MSGLCENKINENAILFCFSHVAAFRNTVVQTSGGSPTSWQLGRHETAPMVATQQWIRPALPSQLLMNFYVWYLL